MEGIILDPEEPLSSRSKPATKVSAALEPTETQEVVFIPTIGSEEELAKAAYLASLANPTPAGQLLAKAALRRAGPIEIPETPDLVYATTEDSVCGINLKDHMIREGSIASIDDWVRSVGGYCHCRIRSIVTQIINRGGLPIVIATETIVLGVIYLKKTQML